MKSDCRQLVNIVSPLRSCPLRHGFTPQSSLETQFTSSADWDVNGVVLRRVRLWCGREPSVIGQNSWRDFLWIK